MLLCLALLTRFTVTGDSHLVENILPQELVVLIQGFTGAKVGIQ